jgi:hypothetical protein
MGFWEEQVVPRFARPWGYLYDGVAIKPSD